MYYFFLEASKFNTGLRLQLFQTGNSYKYGLDLVKRITFAHWIGSVA